MSVTKAGHDGVCISPGEGGEEREAHVGSSKKKRREGINCGRFLAERGVDPLILTLPQTAKKWSGLFFTPRNPGGKIRRLFSEVKRDGSWRF